MVAALAVAACQDANQIEVLHDAPVAAPRVFGWTLIPETAEMSDGVFATDREAWVVGPYGTILHTVDGGAERSSWQVTETGTTSALRQIAAVATPGGSFALVIGAGLVLRSRPDHPGWERLELNPVLGKRPSLHVADDGRVEAWLVTLDGLAYASDARTGMFTRASVPPGATEVIFSDDGDSWTAAPVGAECVPYRRTRGEVDWHPMPIPQPAAVTAPAPRILGPRGRPINAASLSAFASVPACSGAELLVTLQRRKLWFVDDRKDDAVAEWDGKAWIRYPFSTDVAASRPAPPPGGVTDLISAGSAAGDVEFVLALQRTPPAIAPGRLPADPEAALRKDPHSRALAAWAKARGAGFSAADLWMRDQQIWVAGRDGFAHSTDGGQTWVVTQPDPAQPAAAASSRGRDGFRVGRPARALQWKIALEDRGARGWAVSDDGDVFRYDGAWHAQRAIGPMQHALALSISDGGDAAWLLTRNQLVKLTADGPQVAATADRDSMEALLVCPDGRSGWTRYDGYHWYTYDGAAWTKVNARPQPSCISPSCAAALAQADPDTVVCAGGDQLWSLRQGQTADGVVWQYPIPGLDPAQSRAVQLRADSATVPGRLIAISQDGGLLHTDGHIDQAAIVDPGATAEGSDVVLSWALSGPTPVEPSFTIELCEVIVEGICAPDGTRWIPDSDIRQAGVGGRYLATVSPSKLRVQPDTRVQYRVRMTEGELRRKPVRIAEVTRGESLAQTTWEAVRPYAAGIALWFAAIFGLWLFAPYAVLRINDSTRAFASEIPLMGNVLAAAAGAVLARRLVRTRRVVASWTARALKPAGAEGAATGFLGIDDARLRAAFHAMASCQAAWVALHLERAFQTFESSKFATERTTYGETSATVLAPDGAQKLARGIGLEAMRALVAPAPRDPKLVLWIRGQGGVGKSHLACRIVHWLFKPDLRPHPAIVVVIDGNAETQEALDAMIAKRLAALTQATDVEASLVHQLLAAGRVVLVFDGLTERSPKTIDVVCDYLESPVAPALAICTARSAHRFTARRSVTIEPMLLDADELLPFLSSYRLALPPAHRPPEELLEPVRRAAKRIAEGEHRTPLTPLLVMLLWDEAVAGGAVSSLAVEAFNGYVTRALVPAGDAAEHGEQRRLALVRARVLGRLALGKNYRPGRWFTRESAVHALTEAGVASAEHDAVHDFVAAGLLEEDAGGGQLRFVLDPLSEYLCALCILYSFDGDDAGWDQFLATLDAMSPAARASADGFLIALADGWAAYGSSLQLTRAPRIDDVVSAER
jgi:photosynthesis system II assembly factor YCF48-like protein